VGNAISIRTYAGKSSDCDEKIGKGEHIVQIEDRFVGVIDRMIGSNGDHVCGCWEWGAVARIATPHLDLGMRAILVTLDEHQIAWRQARKQILEGGLIRFPKLMHDRPAPWRHEQNFRGTSLTMAPAVGSVVIDV